jgi:hypothetical protein
MSDSPSAVPWKGGITVFHQGYNNSGQLWYTYSGNAETWGGDTLVPDLGMSSAPPPVSEQLPRG